jgi:hypothetical protein
MRWIDKFSHLFDKRKAFKVDNLEELLNAEDAYQSIIELADIISKASYGDGLERFTDPQKNFFYNQWLEMEVNNGGLDQYFFNSCEYAHETVEALKSIGAFKTASILQEGIDRWPDGKIPKDIGKRREISLQINSEVDLYEDLDQKFYEYEEDLSLLNFEYIRKNRDAF